nr:homeobox protein DLX-4 isoform X1 [Globicephala melas]
MTSLPCPLPGPDASKAVFPDIAPVPSVVAAYQLGLSPATAAASDLPYSGPYGHVLPYPYTGPATPGDSYLPCQLPTAPSQQSHQEWEPEWRSWGLPDRKRGTPRPPPSRGRAVPRPRFLERLGREAGGDQISRGGTASAIQQRPRGPALPALRSLRTPVTFRAGREPLRGCGRAEEGAALHHRASRAPESHYSSQPALADGRDGHFSGGCASGEGGPYNRGGDGKPWGTFHTLKLGRVLILAFKAHSAGPL